MSFLVQSLVIKKENRFIGLILLMLMVLSNIHIASNYLFLPSVSIFTITLLTFSIIYCLWTVIHFCILYSFLFIISPLMNYELLRSAPLGTAIWIAFSIVLIACINSNKSAFKWIKLGKIDQISWILIAFTSLLAGVGLIIWGNWTNNLGESIKMMKTITNYFPSFFIVIAMLPAFALFNAFVEEFIFRGVFQEALTDILGDKPVLVISLQSSVFAAIHFAAGFPNGIIGYMMVFIWGVMIGYLRCRTCGMLAPYIVHVCADLVIVFYVFSQVYIN